MNKCERLLHVEWFSDSHLLCESDERRRHIYRVNLLPNMNSIEGSPARLHSVSVEIDEPTLSNRLMDMKALYIDDP